MKSLWTLLLATLFLAGCQPPVRLMPTPEIFLQGEVNPFAVNQALDKSNEIQVFYATNRLPLGPTHARHYTIVPGDNLSLGIATLNIGGGAKTWEWLYQLSTTADDNEDRPPLVLDSMQELAVVDGNLASPLDSPEGDAFFKQINDALEKSVDKDLTIYVHGANTSVERAAGQAAQYRHFTGRNSVVLFFAWPSAENFMRYATDVANARRSEPQFARLLELLSKHTQAKSLNVLAYSAGAMVASPGLARLDQLPQGEEHPAVRLGEIYQAAPDANFRSFAADLQRYVPLARRVTFSANMNDSVLTISRIHQRDGSRAGRPDPTELSLADSEWLINASKTMNFDVLQIKPATIPGMSRRSHNFWFGHPWVSSDVIIKFWFHAPPDARGLQNNASARNLQYWTFPPARPAPRQRGTLPRVYIGTLARPKASSTPRLASSSARSLPGSPEWPFTQRQVILWPLPLTTASSRCHNSTFFTGCLAAVRQPRAFQPWIHSVMPLRTYSLSRYSVTSHGRLSTDRPSITASNSMRLLVVPSSPPNISFSSVPDFSQTPQPPGPGLPLHAPSV